MSTEKEDKPNDLDRFLGMLGVTMQASQERRSVVDAVDRFCAAKLTLITDGNEMMEKANEDDLIAQMALSQISDLVDSTCRLTINLVAMLDPELIELMIAMIEKAKTLYPDDHPARKNYSNCEALLNLWLELSKGAPALIDNMVSSANEIMGDEEQGGD